MVRDWLAAASSITVLSGAGLSTPSGIPDFRGPQGLWTQQPESQRLFSLSAYVSDPEVRRASWRNRRAHAAWTARPNAAHRALVDLERSGRLAAIATQNIDGLHQAAGSSASLVLELHGTLWQAVCLACQRRTPMAAELDRVDAGDPDPACRRCGGLLKSATVSFGQSLDRNVLAAARAAAERSDLFLAIGSSLSVQPAAGLCQVAVDAGARLVVLNAQPTPYDGLAQLRIDARVEVVLPLLIDGLQPVLTTAGCPAQHCR